MANPDRSNWNMGKQQRKIALLSLSIIYSTKGCNGFTFVPSSSSRSFPSWITKTTTSVATNNDDGSTSILAMSRTKIPHRATKLHLKAPPGSGYFVEEDQESFYPETYDPMMEYPGTMRPGRTPENQPYSSLPIQESDPDPVPWPHFQEIEWHHNWGSPHEAPIPMEEFIDMHGRWATAEMEAEMRAGARRGVRERREMEEAQKAASFILDDDDDDDEEDGAGGSGSGADGVGSTSLDLGEGVDALIGAGAVAAATLSASTRSVPDVDDSGPAATSGDDGDDDGDSFLLDLGLDGVGDDDEDDMDNEDDDDDEDGEEPAFATSDDGAEGVLETLQSIIDTEDSSSGAAETDSTDDEIEIDFDDLGFNFDDDGDGDDEEEEGDDDNDEEGDDYVVMDDEDISMENEDLTLDEMIGNEDMGADDEFDDGGFDYD